MLKAGTKCNSNVGALASARTGSIDDIIIMNMIKCKTLAAPYPKKLLSVFPGDTTVIYAVLKKTGDLISELLTLL